MLPSLSQIGATNLVITSSPVRNRLPEQSTSSVPGHAASNRASRDDDASTIALCEIA
jgi:hypothetical protein